MKRLFIAIVALVFVATTAFAWTCQKAATDKHRQANITCTGCLKQVAHSHNVSVPVMIVIPGQPRVLGFNLTLCCDCFQRVVIGKVHLTTYLDFANYGFRIQQEMKAKSAEATKPTTPAAKENPKQ